jgi:hemoglobin
MKETHRGLGITDEEFDYVVEDLCETMTKYNCPEKEKEEMKAMLRTMRSQVVQVS